VIREKAFYTVVSPFRREEFRRRGTLVQTVVVSALDNPGKRVRNELADDSFLMVAASNRWSRSAEQLNSTPYSLTASTTSC
jgi:hypothetical protein